MPKSADSSALSCSAFSPPSNSIPWAPILLYSDPTFLLKQVTAGVFSSVWAFTFTYAMLRIIDGFTTVMVTEQTEELGLDESQLGEHAYDESLEDLVHAGH